VEDVHKPGWYSQAGVPTDRDGIMPFVVYVIRKKGTVEGHSRLPRQPTGIGD
jgi:hypothetical protein